jgi:2-haloacid dehalogenase
MTIRAVVFDVNETLSDMAPLAERFAAVGAPAHLLPVWFAGLLRDGFALTSVGQLASFAQLGREGLRDLLRGVPLTVEPEDAVEQIMSGFVGLGLHPDVAPGVRALQSAGARLVTLSNGAAAVAERLLGGAGLREAFEQLLSGEDAGIWKPAPGAYAYAARACGVDPGELLMVAAHPWDLHGAAHAGLRTAWINRGGRRYPGHFTAPDHEVTGVDGLPGILAGSAN